MAVAGAIGAATRRDRPWPVSHPDRLEAARSSAEALVMAAFV